MKMHILWFAKKRGSILTKWGPFFCQSAANHLLPLTLLLSMSGSVSRFPFQELHKAARGAGLSWVSGPLSSGEVWSWTMVAGLWALLPLQNCWRGSPAALGLGFEFSPLGLPLCAHKLGRGTKASSQPPWEAWAYRAQNSSQF